MKQALSNYGPLAAAIHTTSDLQFYGGARGGRGGDILDIPMCSKQVDHAIVIVGYGTENGKDYWRMYPVSARYRSLLSLSLSSGAKLLGRQVGRGRVFQNRAEQKQHVWHCNIWLLRDRLAGSSSSSFNFSFLSSFFELSLSVFVCCVIRHSSLHSIRIIKAFLCQLFFFEPT